MNQSWVPARYARTAEHLLPAAQAAVAASDLRHGNVLPAHGKRRRGGPA